MKVLSSRAADSHSTRRGDEPYGRKAVSRPDGSNSVSSIGLLFQQVESIALTLNSFAQGTEGRKLADIEIYL